MARLLACRNTSLALASGVGGHGHRFIRVCVASQTRSQASSIPSKDTPSKVHLHMEWQNLVKEAVERAATKNKFVVPADEVRRLVRPLSSSTI